MDSGVFFDYDGSLAAQAAASRPQLLADAPEADWNVLLGSCETLRFRAGEAVLTAGTTDRALYIVADGRLDPPAPAVLGEAEFFSGLPVAHGYRAATDCELLRLSFDAFTALAAHDPRLGRDLLVDLGRRLALQLRA
ncbi:MAG: family transcriptional regulator, cyclic receptor protein [Solirubrobacteraceae bacterium]|nr:family transcriptional regulator, cyclic receptor protein [Solirubrobacteraceae bacterium]